MSLNLTGTANSWTVGNDVIQLGVSITTQGTLALSALGQPGVETGWDLSGSTDVSFLVGTQRFTPGQGDFKYQQARITDTDGVVRLELDFQSASANVRATRVYRCFRDAPAIETWTIFQTVQTSSTVTLSDIGVWQLSVVGTALNWVTGLRASSATGPSYSRLQGPLSAARSIGATGRATSTYMPVVWVDGPAGHLFAGLIWSGAWSIDVTPGAGGRSEIRASLGSIATTMGSGTTIETPHGFYGISRVEERDAARALGAFLMTSVRHGRTFPSPVTYNTWYAYGIQIDEAKVLAEMTRAAALGAELFVVDAGWYTSGKTAADFSVGLGRWTADPVRFPSGLRALGDRAHALGMKFGIWMEPERVDVSTAGKAGLVKEAWLAQTGGRYDPGVGTSSIAQVCLASAEARQWVLDQVRRVIQESGADYLKWDNNFWTNCDRSGHNHGAKDGNLAHHLGLYDLLATLRAEFPDLVIENCSQGGNRIDPGMLQYSDTAWMDDVTAPSAHVRYNLEGLGAIYPPSYLLSFVMGDPTEPMAVPEDMPFLFRSRMPGVLGMSIRGADFGDNNQAAMAAEIALYKILRDHQADASLLKLTPDPGTVGSDGWDGVEILSVSTGNAVVYAFAGGSAADETILHLQGLEATAFYNVTDPTGGIPFRKTGAELMADGISVARATARTATVLVITK